MEDINVLDSIISYLDITIKICHDGIQTSDWYEVNTKTDYDLWIILDGKIKITFNEKEYMLHKNDVFLLYPHFLYRASSVTETCHFAFVHFDARIGNNGRALDAFPFAGPVPAGEIREELALFMNGYRGYKAREPLASFYLKGSFCLLLTRIIRYQYAKNCHLNVYGSKKQTIARIRPVLSYISNNIDKPISIKDLADTAGMSEKYFITFFKDAVGITPANFMLQLRMKKALEYLYEHKYTIKEIAAFVGYEDQYTFSKAFKKIYGVPPSKIV